MNISMIAPIFSDAGLMSISTFLKNQGHQVKLLFIPDLLEKIEKPLPHKSIERVIEFVRGSDLIGISSYSENFVKTAGLVDRIKKANDAPVVWGGWHASVMPEECMQHADYVCVGEGEDAMVELAGKLERGEKIESIKNITVHSNGGGGELGVLGNGKNAELRPPIPMETVQTLDYDLDSQYVMHSNHLRNAEETDFNGVFHSWTTRGCPFICTFCQNAAFQDVYTDATDDSGESFGVRRKRKVDDIISEIKMIKDKFSSVKEIWFNEADFITGKSTKDFEEFSTKYKSEIGIPFCFWAFPAGIKDENVRLLKDAGLKVASIGTVIGSKKIWNDLFKRPASAETYQDRARILKKYDVETEYDCILCNPWENDDDILSTIKNLMMLPKPYVVYMFNLSYFDHTELYDKAVSEGFVEEDHRSQPYRHTLYHVWHYKHDSVYLNIVAALMHGQVRETGGILGTVYGVLPERILSFLIKKPVIKFFNKFFKYLPIKSLIFNVIAGFVISTHYGIKHLRNFMGQRTHSMGQ
jgi:anaerobic magnesium-protoporphyrin IX monomethyl ester cyclase